VKSGYGARENPSLKVSLLGAHGITEAEASRASTSARRQHVGACGKGHGLSGRDSGTVRIMAFSIAGRLIEEPQQTDDGSIAILLSNVRGRFPIAIAEIPVGSRLRQNPDDRRVVVRRSKD
jgi:hypothetical protein